MKLAPMRYKTYIWPYNPKTYTITYERKVAALKVPKGAYFMQDMGRSYRVMRGEGEFAGEGAYDEFKKLATVFYSDGPGPLIHPVWQSSNAYFTALSLKQEPRQDYVSYTFEFWESYDNYAGELEKVTENTAASAAATAVTADEAKYHTVVSGETMWGIAARYSRTLSDLVELNPQIKNPNVIAVGQKVRIA